MRASYIGNTEYKKGSDSLGKPTYYLWRDDFSSQEEYEKKKKWYTKAGFRVVTFKEGLDKPDIEEGIKALIRNHLNDSYKEANR